MSTKIYNAYIWDGSIIDLMDFLKTFRQEYIRVASDHLVLFREYLEGMKEEYKEEGKYFHLPKYLQEKSITTLNDPDNIAASAVVYFVGDAIAVQFFGLDLFYINDDRPLRTLVQSHPKLKSYEYWDNVDAPEDLSENEWDERERFWDFLNVPSEDGLVYEWSTYLTLAEIARLYRKKTS
jgi:hypothetical protein